MNNSSSSSANISELLSNSLDELVKKKAASQKFHVRTPYNSGRGGRRRFANNRGRVRKRNVVNYQSMSNNREQGVRAFSKAYNYNAGSAKNAQKFGSEGYRNAGKFNFRGAAKKGVERWKSASVKASFIPRTKDRNASFMHRFQDKSDHINNHGGMSMNAKYRGDGLLLTPQKQSLNLKVGKNFRGGISGKYVSKKSSAFVSNKSFGAFQGSSLSYNNKNLKRFKGMLLDYPGNHLNTSLYRIRDKNTFLVRANNVSSKNYVHRKGNAAAAGGNSKLPLGNEDADDDNKLHLNMKDRQLMKKIKIVCELSSVPSPSNAQKVACSANSSISKSSNDYQSYYNDVSSNMSGIFNSSNATNNNTENHIHVKTKTLDERFSNRS